MNPIQTILLKITTYGWTIFCLYWLYASIKAKPTVRKESSLSRISYLILLLASFGLVYWKDLSFSFLNERIFPFNSIVVYAGVFISLTGIGFAIVARMWLGNNWSGTVTIKKNHELIQHGPYRFVRHPIYTGVFFGLFGAALIQDEIKDVIAVVLLFIAFHVKISIEERFLAQIFPQYELYKGRTKKIIPFIY